MTTISTPNQAHTPSFDLKWYCVGKGDEERLIPAFSLSVPETLRKKVIDKATLVFDGIEKALKSDVIVDKDKVIQDMQLALKTGVPLTQVESYRQFTTDELKKTFCFTFIGQNSGDKSDFLKTLQNSEAVFRKDRLDAFLAKFNKALCEKAFNQLTTSQKQIYEVALIALSQLFSQNLALTTVLLSNPKEGYDSNTYNQKGLSDGTAQAQLTRKIALLQFYAIKIAAGFNQ